MKKTMIVLGAMVAVMSCGKGNAEESGQAFAVRMFGSSNVRSVVCMDGMTADSDRDGYVSCTIAFMDERTPMAIECATENFGNCNAGCRLATGKSVLRTGN